MPTLSPSPLASRALTGAVLLFVLAAPVLAHFHPHGADTEVYFSGTIRRVDHDARTLVIDAVDPRTRARGDVLVHLDRDAAIRRGKQTITIRDLEPGTRATCAGIREIDEGDRIVLTDIRVSDRRR